MHNLEVYYANISKKLIHFIKIILVLLCFFPNSLFAQDITKEYIIINDSIDSFILNPYLHYYNDENGNLSINEISSNKIKIQFSDSLQLTENTKYIWVFFDIKMKSNNEWLIQTKNKGNTLYTKNNNKWTSNDYLYSNKRFILPKCNTDTLERFYMKIIPSYKIKNTSKINIFLNEKHNFEKDNFENTIFYMLVAGVVFALFFYNLFLSISTKSYSYFLYSCSIFIIGLKLLLFSNLFKELFIGYDYWSVYSNSCTSLTIIFYATFCLAYFKENYKSKWTQIITLFLLIHILISSIHIYKTFYYFDFYYINFGNFSIVSVFFLLFIFSIYKTKNKELGSREFLFANSFLIPIIFATIIVSIFLNSTYTGYILSLGVVIQLLLFSFVLGYRFNLIKKQIAQKESERIELKNKQIIEVQKLTAKKNVELEEKVVYRTFKLQEANQQMGKLIEKLDITNKSLQTTFAELEFQHKKVTDSIYYANNIQKAILPTLSKIKTIFNDSFIFFRPRDVVSGDFYWYMPLENDKYLIGAFDCTGHGVPGAFMSMISYQILNEIVLLEKKIMPNEILDSLRKNLYFSLKQNENSNKDGLDASLILIDKKEKKLHFSGAKNPLYYVKDNEPKILQTIKGTNLYIGGRYNEIDKFELHTVSFYQKNTQFYICSDGIQDQFGGKENKKLMRKVFKDFLLKNQNLSAEKQNEFWNTFITEWQGENGQTDDMLLIGIRPE